MKMKKIVIFFTITLHCLFLSLSGMNPGASNMELEKPDKKRKIATLGEPSQEARKYIKKTPSLSHTQYDKYHRDIVRLIKKAYKKEEFHKQTSELLQNLQNFSQLYPTEYLGFLEVVSILHSLIKQKTLNYPLIQYLFKQPKFLEIQLNVKDSNGNSLEECIKKRKDLKLGIWFATATGRSNPIEDAKLKKLVRRVLSLPCEEKIVCKWNNCSKTYDTYPQFDDHFKEEHKPELARRNNKFHCKWIKNNGSPCHKAYSQIDSLKAHINTHTGKYKCTHFGCNKAFTSQSMLTNHIRTHTGEKPFECNHPGCNKSFTQKRHLTDHKRTHTGEKPFICDYPGCNKTCADRSNLIKHKKTHAGSDKAYKEKTQLRRHERTHRKERPFKGTHGEKPFKCNHPGCNKSFALKAILTDHKRTHISIFNCDHPGCDKAFTQKHHLTEHIRMHIEESLLKYPVSRTHIKEKQYKCLHPGCGKIFTRNGNLTRHMKIHTRESNKRPFKGDRPGYNKSVAQKNNLTKPKKTNTVEKSFTCDHPGCNKSFARKDHLKVHTRTHTKEKPYKCDHPGCNKSFAHNGSLTRHKRTHTGEKPFICDYPGCNKSCADRSNLIKHKKTHAQKSICDICGKTFKNLIEHKKRRHNK